MSYLTFKEIYQLGAINKRMTDIHKDPRFCNKINITDTINPRLLIKKFNDSGTQYLDQPYCSIEKEITDASTNDKTPNLLYDVTLIYHAPVQLVNIYKGCYRSHDLL